MEIYNISDPHPWDKHPELFLYFNSDHLKLHKVDITIYCIGDPNTRGILFPIHIDGIVALSPFKGHFGGIQVIGDWSQEEIKDFVSKVKSILHDKGVRTFELKQSAECYSINSGRINNALISLGFKAKTIERNYHIDVTEQRFEEKIHHSERRKLNKCYSSGFGMQVLGSHGLKESYELINTARQEKNTPMSLSYQALVDLMSVFPNDHFVFNAFDKEHLIATIICIRNHQNVLYSFLPAHLSSYNQHSPLVILYEFIYDYCFKNGIGVLDLGIASDNGIDNEGLMRFKKNLSAIEGEKVTYFLEL